MDAIINVITETWKTMAEMAPYLLLGFGVSGILSVLVSAERIEKHLGGKGLLPVLKAAIFGVPLPLCSCGVIPVAATLRRNGSSRGATMSFLLSTPQTGVDSIFVTYGMLGPVFAIYRPVVAFITGIVGGAVMNGMETDQERKPVERQTDASGDSCCSAGAGRSKVMRALHYGFVSAPADIAKPMLVGLLVAGVLSALVPHDFFAGRFGSGFPAMIVMMLIGIPLYVCATASVPIAAALITAGVSPGAALVFLITGPASNTATIATVWKVLGKKATAVYLGTIAVTSLAAGYTLDLLFNVSGVNAAELAHCTSTSVFGNISAVVLIGVIAYAILKPLGRRPQAETAGEVLVITGMSCAHCVASIKRALGECRGVGSVDVDLKSGKATITGNGYRRQDLVDAVKSLGFGIADLK